MWRDEVRSVVESLEHPAWGPAHCLRLERLAQSIAAAEEPDLDADVLFAAVWLHDIGTFGPYVCSADSPPECAAKGAEAILGKTDFPAEKIGEVTRIIKEHSFEGASRDSAEARVLRDADTLEFLGSVGLVRLLSIVEVEDWVPDPRTAIELAIQFGQDLPDRLFYETSRRMAENRREEASAFLAALADETAQLKVI